jgi:hypothetical protein
VIIDISNQDGIIVGSFTIDANLHNKYDVYQLTPSSAFAGANGKVVIGSLSGISTIVNGIFNFTLSTAELETRCVVPSITGINRIIFDNANGTTYSVSGDVKIEARANLRLTYDGLNNKIILDAGNGLGLNTFCEDDRTPIKTINGVAPNEDGEFFLEFEDCSEWSPIQYGIIVRDTCSQTCAGCSETEAMLNRLIQMEQNILSLRDRYNFLLSSYNEYQSNINSSCVV